MLPQIQIPTYNLIHERLVMRDYYYRYSIAVKDNEEDNSAY